MSMNNLLQPLQLHMMISLPVCCQYQDGFVFLPSLQPMSELIVAPPALNIQDNVTSSSSPTVLEGMMGRGPDDE